MKGLIKTSLLIILGSVLNACSLPGGTIPADHFYRLPVQAVATSAPAVDIQSVRAEGIYNERAILYVDQARPLEIQRYDYHFWVQTPAVLVQNYLQSCFHNTNTGAQSAVNISATITAFERVVGNGKAQAVVKLSINNHDYEATVAANSMDMHATVAAFGKAMQQICESVARDL